MFAPHLFIAKKFIQRIPEKKTYENFIYIFKLKFECGLKHNVIGNILYYTQVHFTLGWIIDDLISLDTTV